MPTPLVGPGVCATCRGPARAGSAICWCCRKVCGGLGIVPESLPPIVPIGLYRPGDPWNVVLRRYKDAPVAAARRYFTGVLERQVERFFLLHGRCLEGETGGFDAFCVVPSSREGRIVRAPHPLEPVLERISPMRSLCVVRLGAGGDRTGHLKPSNTAFVAERNQNGTCGRVLVVDDTWVTGARALSAVAAFSSVGTAVAGVLVLGRSVDTSASSHSRSWWTDHASGWPPGASGRERCCMGVCLAEFS